MPSSPKPPASSLRQWEGIVFLAPSGLAEEIVGQVGDQTHGAAIDPVPQRAGWSQVTIYLRLDGGADPGPAIREALQRHGARAADAEIRRVVVEDGRWVERFQESLHPFDLGRGYRVFHGVWSKGRSSRGGRRCCSSQGAPSEPANMPPLSSVSSCWSSMSRRIEPLARSRLWDRRPLVRSGADVGAGEVLAVDVDPDAVQVAATVLDSERCAPAVSACSPGHAGVGRRDVGRHSSPTSTRRFFSTRLAAMAQRLSLQGAC